MCHIQSMIWLNICGTDRFVERLVEVRQAVSGERLKSASG
jgi:hypothetical protein